MDRSDVNNLLVRGSGGSATGTSGNGNSGNSGNSGSGNNSVKSTDVVMKAVLMEVDAGLKALERR